jgi:hypothetical protein
MLDLKGCNQPLIVKSVVRLSVSFSLPPRSGFFRKTIAVAALRDGVFFSQEKVWQAAAVAILLKLRLPLPADVTIMHGLQSFGISAKALQYLKSLSDFS